MFRGYYSGRSAPMISPKPIWVSWSRNVARIWRTGRMPQSMSSFEAPSSPTNSTRANQLDNWIGITKQKEYNKITKNIEIKKIEQLWKWRKGNKRLVLKLKNKRNSTQQFQRTFGNKVEILNTRWNVYSVMWVWAWVKRRSWGSSLWSKRLICYKCSHFPSSRWETKNTKCII